MRSNRIHPKFLYVKKLCNRTAHIIERMNDERCIAILVSFALVFTIRAKDDVIERMEVLFSDLFRKSNNKGTKKRLRTI
ncbi:hypothetical protein COD84_31200 [Bacillus cereus]|nr:hypothetical protein COD84_31200 [Bacillus cereus]